MKKSTGKGAGKLMDGERGFLNRGGIKNSRGRLYVQLLEQWEMNSFWPQRKV